MTGFILYLTIVLITHQIGLWLLFQKAGEVGWKSLIPLYNYYLLVCKINGRQWWYFLLLLTPIVGCIALFNIRTDTARSFNQFKFKHDFFSVMFWSFYVLWLGYEKSVKYIAPAQSEDQKNAFKKAKESSREWKDALFFAAVVATWVRMFYIEAYTIPTPSMEKSLMVGDFLFVSKTHYGARIPITPIAFPFAHHTMPVLGSKAYLEFIQLPYMRLPALEKVKNNDIVVFNFPIDSLRNPIDKKENFVKRCIGIPGDSIKIINDDVYINNVRAKDPANLQKTYFLSSPAGRALTPETRKRFDLTSQNGSYHSGFALTDETVQQLKQEGFIDTIIPLGHLPGVQPDSNATYSRMFPEGTPVSTQWSIVNYGAIWVPKKGSTITMNATNFYLYRRVIEEFEDNGKIYLDGDKVTLNGKRLETYTFKYDYYWMMGDNRHNSEDSRYWGFVPETHIVGKPVFIWLSINYDEKNFFKKIRWNRLFRIVNHQE